MLLASFKNVATKKKRKTCLSIHKEMYKNHILHYKDSIARTKTCYYSNMITANKGNS